MRCVTPNIRCVRAKTSISRPDLHKRTNACNTILTVAQHFSPMIANTYVFLSQTLSDSHDTLTVVCDLPAVFKGGQIHYTCVGYHNISFLVTTKMPVR